MSTLMQTLPATLPTVAPTTALTGGATWQAYAAGTVLWVGVAAMLVAIGWATGISRRLFAGGYRPAPDATSQLWVGVAVLSAAFILTPALFSTAIARWVGNGDLGGLLLMTGVYVVGLSAVALLYRSLKWRPLDTVGLSGPLTRWHVAATFLAIPVAFSLTTAAANVVQLVLQLMHVEHDATHALLQEMGRNRRSHVVMTLAVLCAAVLAPLFEELLFRGHLQTALRKLTGTRSAWPAILMTSLLFASIHSPPAIVPPIFVLSLVIGYAYERTGSMWVALAIHASFNATSTAYFLLSTRG